MSIQRSIKASPLISGNTQSVHGESDRLLPPSEHATNASFKQQPLRGRVHGDRPGPQNRKGRRA